jgi:hypothetical protein
VPHLRRLGVIVPLMSQPSRAGLTLAGRPSGPREPMRSPLRFSHAGADEARALPARKRVIRIETLSQSAQALLPPRTLSMVLDGPLSLPLSVRCAGFDSGSGPSRAMQMMVNMDVECEYSEENYRLSIPSRPTNRNS